MSHRFEDHCPQIVSGDTSFSDGRLVFAAANGNQISLPSNAHMILELCDGEHSVRNIATKMLAEGNSLSFRLLMDTLKSLKKADLLKKTEAWPELDDETNNSLEERSLWRKSLLSIPLSQSSSAAQSAHSFFTLLVALIIVAASYRLAHLLPWHVPADFLRPQDSYFSGLLFLICAISFFRLGKGLCQGLLIKNMTGRSPQMTLEVQPLGLAIETNASQVWEGSPIQHLGFALASSATPLTLAALFFLAVENSHWERDLGILALLWTFFELSPFRGSDFTWFFSRRAHGAHSEHLGPFLRKKSLFALFQGKNIEGEKTLLAFASLSIFWVFGFLFFCLSVFNAGFAHLFADLNLDIFGNVSTAQPSHAKPEIGILDSIAAGMLLLSLFMFFISWVRQVVNIFFSNALEPLQGSLKSIARNMGSSVGNADATTAAQLAQFPIFSQLPKETLESMTQAATFKSFKKGTRVLIQGEEGEEAYVLLRGAASIERQESTGLLKNLATLGPGAVFGEMGLIEKTTRTADVVAIEDCYAMLLTNQLLDDLKAHSNEHQTILDRIFISQHMASSDLFKSLPPEAIHLFANKGTVEHLDSNQIIIEQNDVGSDFFLLLRGRVTIEKDQKTINSIEQGGFFGEIALLADTERTATVKTAEPTAILKIDAAAFWDVLSNNINMATLIENVAESRLGEATHA